MRIFFTLTLILFSAGLCIKIWKDFHINYLYILQIDYEKVIFWIQFVKLSLIYFFIDLIFLFFFMKKIEEVFG